MSGRVHLGLAGGVLALAGCTSVLGLDAPTLDPCADEPCADATTEAGVDAGDAGAGDAGGTSDSANDACVWDGAVTTVNGAVRCGGGCSPTMDCSGSTPVCCQTEGATGVVAYACVSAEAACQGYAIDCVNENDCSGNAVCCHYLAHTVCAASCTSGGDIACIPGSADDCPTGKKCDVLVTDVGDASAPYYTCQP